MTFAAVVVSYNRIELLKRCLQALTDQTRPLDEIIVVDNGSTDGSAEFVAEHYPDITLFRTGENLGGAGGFAWGLEIALAHGHEGAWLMDDDAEPELDAAAPLIEQFERMDQKPAILASLVISPEGTPNRGNAPSVSLDAQRQLEAARYGAFAIDGATFVGTMINLREARGTHLPIADYFIWLDDAEYTYRLSQRGLAMTIPSSRIVHPENTVARPDMGPRLFYFVRNNFWRLRARDVSTARRVLDMIGVVVAAFGQLKVASNRRVWAASLRRGVWEGLFRRPRNQKPGALLATLSADERAAIGC